MPTTRNQKKGKSEESTGASGTDLSVLSGGMDKYLMPKQDTGTITQCTEETDIQEKLNKILVAVKPIDEMNNKIDKLTRDFAALKGTVDKHTSEISDIKKDLETKTQQSEKFKQKIDNMDKDRVSKVQLTAMETFLLSENRQLRSEMTKLEEYSRRNNLLFHGLDERQGEDCIQKVQSFINQHLELHDAGRKVMISRAHRVGPKTQDRVRPILAQFVLSTDV